MNNKNSENTDGDSRQVDAIIMLQDMDLVVYGNTVTTTYFDGENYYNNSGQLLRDPEEYNQWSEGYTSFGDE